MYHEEIASDSWVSCDSTIQLQNPPKKWKSTVFSDQLHLNEQGGKKKDFYQERQKQTCIKWAETWETLNLSIILWNCDLPNFTEK